MDPRRRLFMCLTLSSRATPSSTVPPTDSLRVGVAHTPRERSRYCQSYLVREHRSEQTIAFIIGRPYLRRCALNGSLRIPSSAKTSVNLNQTHKFIQPRLRQP